jgi:hypothetical protein
MRSHRILLALLALSSLPCWAAQPSLCTAQEESVFWCNTRTKRFELCASADLRPDAGYMQYRAGSNGKVDFVVPSDHRTPVGVFKLELLAKGTVLSFENGKFLYEIYQPVDDRASIVVTPPGKPAAPAVRCQADSDTLNLTPTMKRFEALGVYK